MKRPRGEARKEVVEQLRLEVPFVRHAWELGRLGRRVLADLRVIAESNEHRRIIPTRATDPHVSVATRTDRKLASKLREIGAFDENGLIYGGRTVVAHRPFTTESIIALKTARFDLERLFVQAAFASELERDAFWHTPKSPREDAGAPRKEDWEHAWVQITAWNYGKAVACEAIGLRERTYDERRRRPRAKSGGLSLNDQELIDYLRARIVEEEKSIENHEGFKSSCEEVARLRGLRIPVTVRRPKFARSMRARLPEDCRFLVDDYTRWKARAPRQPKVSRTLWNQLIELREKRIVGTVANFALSAWMTQHTK